MAITLELRDRPQQRFRVVVPEQYEAESYLDYILGRSRPVGSARPESPPDFIQVESGGNLMQYVARERIDIIWFDPDD